MKQAFRKVPSVSSLFSRFPVVFPVGGPREETWRSNGRQSSQWSVQYRTSRRMGAVIGSSKMPGMSRAWKITDRRGAPTVMHLQDLHHACHFRFDPRFQLFSQLQRSAKMILFNCWPCIESQKPRAVAERICNYLSTRNCPLLSTPRNYFNRNFEHPHFAPGLSSNDLWTNHRARP